jgi:hypothetical protein
MLAVHGQAALCGGCGNRISNSSLVFGVIGNDPKPRVERLSRRYSIPRRESGELSVLPRQHDPKIAFGLSCE